MPGTAERISSIADIEALQREFTAITQGLSGITKQIVDINKLNINIEAKMSSANNLKDVVTTSNELVDVQGKLIKATGDLNAKNREAITLVADLNGYSKASVQATRDLLKLDEQAAKAKIAQLKAEQLERKAIEEQERKAIALAKERETADKSAALAASDRLKVQSDNTIVPVSSSPAVVSGSVVTGSEQASLQAQLSAQRELAAATTTTAKTRVDDAAAADMELTKIQQLAQTQLVASAELAGVNAALKDNTKAFIDGKISEEQYLENGTKLTADQALLKNTLAGVNAELKNQTELQVTTATSIEGWRAKVGELTKERNKLDLTTAQGTVRQKELNEEIDKYNALIRQNVDAYQKQKINIGNYPTLTAQLKDVRQEMERLVQSGKSNTTEFSDLAEKAKDLAGKIDEVKEATKKNNEEAEDGEKKTGLLSKAFAGLKTIANILPGLGISTLLLLIGTAAQAAGKKVLDFATGVKESILSAEEVSKVYSDISKKSIGNYTQEIVTLEVLKKRFEDTNASQADQKEVVLQLNEVLGDQYKKISSISDAEKFFRDKSGDFIAALQLRAKAAGALAVIQDNYAKDIEQAADPESSIGFAKKTFITLGAVGQAFGTFNNKNILQKFKENYDKALSDEGHGQLLEGTTKRAEATRLALEALVQAQDEASKIDKKNGFNTTGVSPAEAAKQAQDITNAQLAADKRYAEAKAANDKQVLEEDARAQQDIIDNTKNALQERLDAQAIYETDLKQINDIDKAKELSEIQSQLDKIKEIESKSVTDRTNQEKILLLNKRALLEEQSGIEEKYSNKDNEIYFDGQKKRRQIESQLSAQQLLEGQQNAAENLELLSQTNDEEQKKLKSQYDKNKISKERYLNALKQLQLDNAKAVIQIQIDQLEAELASGNLTREDYEKTLAALNKLKAAIKNLGEGTGKGSSNIFKINDDDLKKAQSQYNEYSQAANSVSTLLTALSQKRVDEINAESEAIDARTQKEIDAVNQSTASEAVKAQKIAEINAKAQAQKDVISARAKAQQHDDAVRQKSLALALATIKGILFVLESTSIPEAIARGIVVAAEVATIAATPIPSYAEGTDDHKGGKAMVSDHPTRQDKREVVILPTGETFITPSQPTVLDLPKHSQVIPSIDEYIKMTYGMTMSGMGIVQHHNEYDGTNVVQEIAKMRRDIISTLRDSEPVKLHGVDSRYKDYIVNTSKH